MAYPKIDDKYAMINNHYTWIEVPSTPVYPTDGLVERYSLQDTLAGLNGNDLTLIAGSTTYAAGNNGNALVLSSSNSWKTANNATVWNIFDSQKTRSVS